MKNISLMVKPASGHCSMRCRYCFYTDEMSHRAEPLRGIMQDSVREALIRRLMEEAEGQAYLVFQGGEPLLAGLSYFERLIDQENQWNRNSVHVHHSIQTNGLLIEDKWADFLKKNHFLTGLSVDGSREIHDSFRVDVEGKGTYQEVERSAKLLAAYGVDFNILTVVTRQVARRITRIYREYVRKGWKYMQFIPCLDGFHEARGSAPWSLRPEDYAVFLKNLFDEWYRDMEAGKKVSVRYFDNLLQILSGKRPESCSLLGGCTPQLVVEADGSVYPCDFYVTDDWKLGNICDMTIPELVEAGREFRAASLRGREACRDCHYEVLCWGGCRRDCDWQGEIRGNYYCEAYKDFFDYAGERLLHLAGML